MREEEMPPLSLSIIEALKNRDLNQSDIARMYGLTRQAVSWWVRHYNGQRTLRQRVLEDHFPFEVPTHLGQTAPFKRLRDHGEYMATGGVGMSEDKRRRLRSFYRKLRDEGLVLEYDPNIPPTPGVSKEGGWAYRHRQAEDGDLLIRVNEFTNLTKDGEKIWRFPLIEP